MSIRDIITKIEEGPENAYGMTDDELGDWWADAAMRLASAVKSDTVEVAVEFDGPYGETRTKQTLTLPAWCSGSPDDGAALYLFGYASAKHDFQLTATVLS